MNRTKNGTLLDDRDWSSLTRGEQIRSLELDGYLVLPDLLTPEHIARLKAETAQLNTVGLDYSVKQQTKGSVQFMGGAITDLIAHPPTTGFLSELFGDDVVFMTYAYARSEPGHPGISFHTDGQPYGSAIFGYEGSCPWLVRVLYYLDDLTEEVSPFRVVPRSHLSFHADNNPYKRYAAHPDEVMVTARAGSAVLLNHKCWHGNFPNVGDRYREMLAIAYRPGWAGPVEEKIAAWNPADLAKLPPAVRPFFIDRNTRKWEFAGGNKPANMASDAPGISPGRWDRP